MGRTLAALFGLALTLLSARDARAIPITPGDFPSGGTPVLEHRDFIGSVIGEIDSFVSRDPLGRYVYEHRVTPWYTNNTIFDTQFTVHGFAGVAGWFFQEALEAGGTGTDADFRITYKARGEPLGPGEIPGQLRWTAQAALDWDGRDPITFFFVSNLPPAAPGALRKDYRLVGDRVGTAQVPAPVPEPASIVLFGSALLALHSARRRRRCRV
jgi:hypothetical protein